MLILTWLWALGGTSQRRREETRDLEGGAGHAQCQTPMKMDTAYARTSRSAPAATYNMCGDAMETMECVYWTSVSLTLL